MFDEDHLAVGHFIETHVPVRTVMLHRDFHIFSSGSIAGRTTLLAYTGWMSSHGYDYTERDRDRNYILAHALKDSDKQVCEGWANVALSCCVGGCLSLTAGESVWGSKGVGKVKVVVVSGLTCRCWWAVERIIRGTSRRRRLNNSSVDF